MTMNLSFDLPFPPSVNTYYRSSFRSRSVYLSEKGREFHQLALVELRGFLSDAGTSSDSIVPSFPTERLRIIVELIPGNRRSFDIDGRLKALLDTMEGYIYTNDSQVDELEVIRKPMEKGKARCRVTISEIKEQSSF
jgi:crossover junction endodeoxyribonuclease RusA